MLDFWDTAGQEAFNRMHPSYVSFVKLLSRHSSSAELRVAPVCRSRNNDEPFLFFLNVLYFGLSNLAFTCLCAYINVCFLKCIAIHQYYRAHCCILVFDVTRKVTYQHLSDWYQELRDHCDNIPCVLVANKIDVDYNVSSCDHPYPPLDNGWLLLIPPVVITISSINLFVYFSSHLHHLLSVR